MKRLCILIICLLLARSAYAADTKAKRIRTETTNFDVNLSAADTDVQTTLETLDEPVNWTVSNIVYANAAVDTLLLYSSAGTLDIQDDAAQDVDFYSSAASGENPITRFYGYITAAGFPRYCSFQVNDSDDWFDLSRQNTNINGFKINMPVDTVDNYLDTNHIGLGNSASGDEYIINASETYTHTSTTRYGLDLVVRHEPANTTTLNMTTTGLFFDCRYNSALSGNGIGSFKQVNMNGIYGIGGTTTSGTGSIYSTTGCFLNIAHQGTGTITNATGLFCAITATGAGNNITTAKGIDLYHSNVGTTATGYHIYMRNFLPSVGHVTNGYGLYIEELTGATNNYAVWLEGANRIYFRDTALTIHSAADGDLDIEADTTIDFNINSVEQVSIDSAKITIGKNTVFTPSSTTNITAAGGITVTNTIMRIQGNGGAIDITANPQIAAGTDGQIVTIEGMNDTNTVTIDNGTGVNLHNGKAILGNKDYIKLIYNSTDSEWHEISRNFPQFVKSLSFVSPTGTTGTFYVGGYYIFGSTDNDFNPAINLGTANISYAAHVFLVQAAGGAGGTDTVVRVSGTSINDQGTRTAADTEDLTVDDAGAAGTYYETTKKWIGQVTLTKQSGPDLLMNYGFCKYWDNNNNDFQVTGIEITGRAGANDATPNISLLHHKSTGWTYNNGAAPTRPTALADMNTDHNTEIQFATNIPFSWKRDNLSTDISGSASEGTIVEIITNANQSIDIANIVLSLRPK